MTVADMRRMFDALPDSFGVAIESDGELKQIRSVSLETGRLVLRDHMLSVAKIVNTFTAHDGVEYVLTIERAKYPTVIQMPNPIHSQLLNSVRKESKNNA